MKDFFKLAKYIKSYWHFATLNIVFNLVAVVFSLFSLTLVIPFLSILFDSKKLVTELVPFQYNVESLTNILYYHLSQVIVTEGKVKAVLMVCFLVITASFLKNLFGYFASFFMAPTINGVTRDIQNKMYKKILELPLSYYSDERKGNIMARLTNDVLEIKVSIMSTLDMIFRDPITIIIYFFTLLFMSPQLTVFVILLLPVSGLIIGGIGRSLRGRWKKSREKYGVLISMVEETLSGLRIVKAFNAENRIYNRFYVENNQYTKIVNKVTRLNSLAVPMSEFLGTAVVVTVLYYGVSLVMNNESSLSPENFIGYIVIFSQIITPAKNVSNSYYNIQKGLASMDRINVVMNAENTITEKENAQTISSFNKAIEFKNVSFRYNEKGDVLRNINLVVEKGKCVALVGQSGSGKSTMVDLLPRFWDIEQGEILVDGVNIKDYKITDLRSLMGNVNQESILFNDSIANNIAFGVENATREEIIAAAKIANAHEFIMEMPQQYDSFIGDRGGKLSGGQRQRLSIARAVLKNPPILILDEATSALDTESERLVQEALVNLMKNRTSLVIAHRLSTIKHADEICVLQNGEIVERGKHSELIEKNGVYRRLTELQLI